MASSGSVGYKSLRHAMSVLECFSVDKPEIGVTEIAQRTGLQKSTVHAILTTFQSMGYIGKNPDTSRYFLGNRLLHFSYIINCRIGLREQFLPYLNKIAEATHEVCYFGVLDHQEVLYLESAYPPGQSHLRNILGERAPLYCTGLGKAMMANLPEDEREALLALPMTAYTDYTVVNPAVLRQELSEVRANGYAADNMEHEFGIRCVAVPVFGSSGRVIAAVSVSGPSLRFDPQTIIDHAALITRTLQPLQHCF